MDVEHIDGADNGIHGELVVEVLIKLAIAAEVVMQARPEIDALLQTVQARALASRKISQLLPPGDNSSALSAGRLPLLPQPPVFGSDPPQGAVEVAGRAIILGIAKPPAHDTRLHPDAGMDFAVDSGHSRVSFHGAGSSRLNGCSMTDA
jgi:hypothetical protein